MPHPIANLFRSGALVKPIVKKEEFYKGGLYAMQKRFRTAMQPFYGAYSEYEARIEDQNNIEAVALMFDYLKLE